MKEREATSKKMISVKGEGRRRRTGRFMKVEDEESNEEDGKCYATEDWHNEMTRRTR